MLRSFLISLCCFFSSVSLAEQTIAINPMKGDKKPSIEETKTVTGTCGNSIIRITGITRLDNNVFSLDADSGMIIVRQSFSKRLKIDDSSEMLNDRNGLACIKVRNQENLLLWSYCTARMCQNSLKFFVIDPSTLARINSTPAQTENCDAKCISNLLDGHPLPETILTEHNALFGIVSEDCPIPGDPLHWIADYCMSKYETGDLENPSVSNCIGSIKINGAPSCEIKREYKKKLCELAVARNNAKLDLCFAGTAITGSTVRNNGH